VGEAQTGQLRSFHTGDWALSSSDCAAFGNEQEYPGLALTCASVPLRPATFTTTDVSQSQLDSESAAP